MGREMLALVLIGSVAWASEPDVPAADPVVFRGHTFRVERSALSPDGKFLASGGGDLGGGELKLWDAGFGKGLATLPGYTSSFQALAFSPSGALLATSNTDYKVRIWELAARRELIVLDARFDAARAVAFSQDGKWLASAGRKEVRLWDVATGKQLAAFERSVTAPQVAFSNDLRTLASPNFQEIDLWDLATGKRRLILSEHRGAVKCVAFTADDKTLAAASTRMDDNRQWFGQVKLWDVARGQERQTLSGSFGRVMALAFSPDGTSLALLDRRNAAAGVELKVLDLHSGRQRVLLKIKGDEPLSLMFDRSGTLSVLARAPDNTIKLWRTPLGQKHW